MNWNGGVMEDWNDGIGPLITNYLEQPSRK